MRRDSYSPWVLILRLREESSAASAGGSQIVFRVQEHTSVLAYNA